MRVLITGAAGFIGSHLSERFLNDGAEVIGVDNLLTGSEDNVKLLRQQPNFTYIHQNVSEPYTINQKLDYVLHFASPASPPDFERLPMETLMVSSYGTRNTLEVAKAHEAAFLVASTSETYGEPQVHPQTEQYWGNVNPIGPRSVYDEGKRFTEAMTMAYYRYKKVNTHIVRIFNTYGPRMRPDDGRVVPNFIKQALADEPMTLYGEGSQTRSFCFVTDLVEGLVRLVNSDFHEPVNIGNPNEITVKQLGEIIFDILGKPRTFINKPLPVNDPTRRKPDITRAKDILDWEPKIPVEEGIKKTIEWFKVKLGY